MLETLPQKVFHSKPNNADCLNCLQHWVILRLSFAIQNLYNHHCHHHCYHHCHQTTTSNLETRHGVESHPDGGDDDEHHGDEGHDVGCGGGLGVLH